MLTMENVTALRMRRHCLTRRAGAAEYDALYRDLACFNVPRPMRASASAAAASLRLLCHKRHVFATPNCGSIFIEKEPVPCTM